MNCWVVNWHNWMMMKYSINWRIEKRRVGEVQLILIDSSFVHLQIARKPMEQKHH